MAKKRAKAVTELHSKPRAMNDDVRGRVVVLLKRDLILKLKTQAYESRTTMQKFVSDLLEKHLGD